MNFLNLLTLAVGDILRFSALRLNNFVSNMLETTASINRLIRINTYQETKNAVTDIL